MKTQIIIIIIIIILRINRLTINGEIKDIGSLDKSATYSAINQANLGNKNTAINTAMNSDINWQ